MSTQTENTKHIDRIIEEAWNNGNLEVIDELVASDYELHVPNAPKEFRGPEGFKEFVQMYRTAFPDLTLSVEDRVVEGDKIADRMVSRGTHEGELMSIEPTGKETEMMSMVIHHLEDGKVVADDGLLDNLGLLQQLGVVELPTE
jgi:steroid delta-isomerase-like uncharacterized protein